MAQAVCGDAGSTEKAEKMIEGRAAVLGAAISHGVVKAAPDGQEHVRQRREHRRARVTASGTPSLTGHRRFTGTKGEGARRRAERAHAINQASGVGP